MHPVFAASANDPSTAGPIDAVYTWVDGDSPDYQALQRRYSQRAVDLNPERTRDQYELLKYSLRSVQQFAPWIGNIVLLTCRPQVPSWLDTAHPRVRIVHHDEIMDGDYLPTFNCNVIESYLHRVPTSSDTFLYLNDDFLFGAPTPYEYFFNNGRIQVMGTLFGERLGFRVYEQKNIIVHTGLMEHTPLLVNKPHWDAMTRSRPGALHRTRTQRFRQGDDLKMDRLYRYYHLSRPDIPTRAVPFWRLLRYHRFHKITNDYARQKRALTRLFKMRPRFYCLNDDQRGTPNPRVVRLVRDLLETWYPDKSEFEE